MQEPPLGNDFVSLIGQSRINQLGRRFINGRPLSMETRYRIVELHNKGVKPCKISRELQVSHGAVSKILNRYAETGSIEPGKIGGNPRCRLAIQSVKGRLLELLRRQPEASAAELCAALVETGVCTSDNVPTACSINRYMRSHGMKRRSRPPGPQPQSDVDKTGASPCNDTWMLEWGTVSSSSTSSPSAGDNLSPPSDAFGGRVELCDRIHNENESEATDDVDISSVSDGELDRDQDEDQCPGITSRSESLSAADPNKQSPPSPLSRSCLNYGISAILGSSSGQNNASPKKAQIYCAASTASTSASDEENWAESGRRKRQRPPTAATTAVLPDSSTSAARCGRPLDTFTKYAESTGGMAEYRRSRTCFTAGQLQTMERSFDANNYPDEVERQRLIYCTGLDDDKIITWFSNRRARKRKICIKNLPADVVRALEDSYGPLPVDPAQLNNYVKTVWREATMVPQEQQKRQQSSPVTVPSTTTAAVTQINPCQFEFLVNQLIQQQRQQQQQKAINPTVVAQLMAGGNFAALAQQQFLSQLQQQMIFQQQQNPLLAQFSLLQQRSQQQQLTQPFSIEQQQQQQKLLFAQIFNQTQQQQQQQQFGLPFAFTQ